MWSSLLKVKMEEDGMPMIFWICRVNISFSVGVVNMGVVVMVVVIDRWKRTGVCAFADFLLSWTQQEELESGVDVIF